MKVAYFSHKRPVESQVRTLSLGALYSVVFISGYGHAMTIHLQQLFDAIAGFVNILHYQNDQVRLIFLFIQAPSVHSLSLIYNS